VKELTKEVKDIHDAMTLIANEKIRLAQMALDLVKGNAALLDAELKLFHKELEEQGINPEDEFDAESYMPPPAPPPTKLSKLQHSQDKRAQAAAYVAQRKVPSTVTSLGIGDLVAANIGVLNQHAGGQEWIVATVTRYSPADGVFEIVDADEEAEKHVYRLPQKYVIPLPKTAAVRHSQNFPAGTSVLAVYPNTTTFYKANVVQSARRLPNAEYSEFVLEFEDDGDVEGDAPAHRAVPFRHVVLFPG
jgi:SAGA-associated factor 29